jgi:ornithine decarboxylase
MTDKIFRFLAEEQPPTPCVVVDLERVARNFASMRAAFPRTRIFYAVKANPAPQILKLLQSAGSYFDAASIEEIELCLRVGARPDQISFGNTIKKASAIARAYAAGVGLFVFDCAEELAKIAAHAPGSLVFCRIAVGTDGAVFPLAKKFGTSPAMAAELLCQAARLGLVPYGVSFHVGSQQTGPEAYEAAIGEAASVFALAAQAGIALRMLNLGGGFPARYQDEVCGIGDFAHGVDRALERHFGGELPETLVEPGRFLVGDAGVVSTEVVLVSRRGSSSTLPRWVYLDIGRFGGLSETEGEATRYVFRTPHDATVDGPVIIAGPTCDSADTLYERSGYRMPLALSAGDRIEILATGAYVTSYATIGFNGFPPMAEYYI